MRPVLDMEWNERNRRAALRMVGDIRDKIRHGRFDPADYFPEYSGLETLTAHSSLSTFRDYAQAWLRSLGQKAAATRDDYRKALDLVWLDELGERPIKAIRYDGADKSRERDKLNLGFGHDLATELIAEAKKFAQSNTYLAEREGAIRLYETTLLVGVNTPIGTPPSTCPHTAIDARTALAFRRTSGDL